MFVSLPRGATKETFVGLDVSAQRNKCLHPEPEGGTAFEGKVESQPAVIARLIRKDAPVVRVGLERADISMADHTSSARGFGWSVSMLGIRRRCCRYDRTKRIA